LNVGLIVVLEVRSYTGEVCDNGDVELLEFLCGTDTTELEELRRVLDTRLVYVWT
jgi:hypothetical protein